VALVHRRHQQLAQRLVDLHSFSKTFMLFSTLTAHDESFHANF